MARVFHRWLHEDDGQDLLEYVLLGATVALGSLVAMNLFGTVINAVYQSWDTATQNAWEPQAPANP